MIRIRVGGEIEVLEASEETRQAFMKALRLKNPTFHQAIRANPRARFAINEWVKYYELRKTGELVAPRGVLSRLEDYARKTGQELIVEDQRTSRPTTCEYPIINLRDYQLGVTEAALSNTQGVLRLDTGFGKTIVGLDLISKLKERTLIIVPKLDLLSNWEREADTHLGQRIGVIQGRTTKIGEGITAATIQTLHKRIADGSLRGDEFGCVIVDECHGFVSENARRTIGTFTAKYRYGLTATARRTDGQGEAIGFIFGNVLVDKKMARATPKVEIVPSLSHIWVQEYAQMIDGMIQNKERNALITKIVEREVDSGRKILVLTKRVEHYETLKELILRPAVYIVSSSEKKEVRAKDLAAYRSGDLDFSVLLGTTALLATGIDIPKIDTVVFACDLKSDVLVEQGAGRCLRLFDGKKTPKIIDIVDVNNGILRRQARLREEWYRSVGWEVVKS